MTKGSQSHNLPADLAHLIDQLDRHCLAGDGSLISKPAHSDLLHARDEMSRERTRYLEALAVYSEALAIVEDHHHHHHSLAAGSRPYFQVYECLEHRLSVAEAAQRLRLPLLSKDGEIHEDEIEKMSRSSLDSAGTGITLSSSTNSTGYNASYASSGAVGLSAVMTPAAADAAAAEPGVGGVANRFLGVTAGFLWQVQQEQPAMAVDAVDYQQSVVREIESRLEAKCDSLADIFAMDEIADSSSISQIPSARLPERVKLIIEEIEKEEAVVLDDLYSMDRKFAEHYNVLEQILGVLVKFVKDLKLQHQHQYDELKKTWLCKRCQTMNAKLRVLEHILLRDTYTKDSVPALHRIRKYLVEATEEASIAYNKVVTRLREYQGVDPHFDTIARQYHEIVKKLEGMQWTIHQVEMDLKRSHDLPAS